MPEFGVRVAYEVSRLIKVTAENELQAYIAASDWFELHVPRYDSETMEELELVEYPWDFNDVNLSPDAVLTAPVEEPDAE